MIDRGAPEPLYAQLADELRRRIQDGTYPPRTAVPSISRLAAEFGLSDPTVKKAITALKREGLLTGTPGRGTFVAERSR